MPPPGYVLNSAVSAHSADWYVVTGRPVRLARDWALAPAGSATQLSMSVPASSYTCRSPLKPAFSQRQSSPGPQLPTRAGEAAWADVDSRKTAMAKAPTLAVMRRVVMIALMVEPEQSYVGVDRLPRRTACLLASNHRGAPDWLPNGEVKPCVGSHKPR